MFRKTLSAAAMMLAVHGAALAQTLNEGEVLGNFSPTPGPAVPTDLTGPAGFGLFGNGVGAAPSYQGYLGYSGSTERSWQSKAGDSVNIMDYAAQYNCIPGDYTTDCTAAFNAALAAVFNYSQSNGGFPVTRSVSGTVHVPASAGCFRIASPITMLQGTSLIGEGGLGSCILADDTDALHYGFAAQYGQPQVSNIFLYGCKWDGSACIAPTAARTAILRVYVSVPPHAPNADTDRMLGLAIQNMLIWGFDTAIDVTTVGNLWVTNSYFQNVNNCAKINGISFGARFQGFQCTYGIGDGLGSRGDGITANPFTYTDGSTLGPTGPEAVEINQSQIFDFNNAIWSKMGGFTSITSTDVQASVNGIRFSDVFGGYYVRNSYIGMNGADNAHGIWAEGIAAPHTDNHQTVIDGNTLIATGSVIGSCIQIGANQDSVHVAKNQCLGFVSYDFKADAPRNLTVEGNSFQSTGVTDSINIGTRQSGVIKVAKNVGAETISNVTASDLTNGYVRFCDNVSTARAGATLDNCDVYRTNLRGSTTAGAINSNGNIAANTFNNVIISEPSSTARITMGNDKVLLVDNSLEFTGTDGSVVSFGAGGTVLYNGGALGSPSSAGTLPAFSLGGTVNGGGNQINNVVIGASTPLAGTFTTLQANTSLTSALQVGGSGAASTLTLESTSGAGTSDAIIGRTGSQTERFRVTTGGLFNIGPAFAPDTLLTVNGNTGAASIGSTIGAQQLHLIAPDATIGGVIADVFGAQGFYANRHASGTLASMAPSAANTTTFSIGAQHWDTMAYSSSSTMDFGTINTQSTSDHGGFVRIRTAKAGTTPLAERLRVQQGLGIGSVADPGAGAVLLNPQLFSALTACSSTIKGASAYVSDSSTNVWGATITGSGANNVLASCNGTNWTVAGK